MVKKRSRVVYLLVILVFTILILAVIIFTYLGTQSVVVPGVAAGDVFTYEVKGLWESDDPNATISDSLLQLNMTEWYRVTVTGVSGAEVSINTTWRFNNGTEVEGTGTVDVETGIKYPTEGFWAIYATNLMAGDYVRPIGADRSTINETTTREYGAGGTRETNRISLVLEYYDANDPTYSTTWTEYMNTHFDRQTGMLVELHDANVYTNPQVTLTILWTIKDTNVWTIS